MKPLQVVTHKIKEKYQQQQLVTTIKTDISKGTRLNDDKKVSIILIINKKMAQNGEKIEIRERREREKKTLKHSIEK